MNVVQTPSPWAMVARRWTCVPRRREKNSVSASHSCGYCSATWATGHGLETTRTFAGGPVVCAVATEDVLDGLCLPSEATMLQRVRREGIPCISVHDAPERIIDEIGALTPLTVLHTEADAESLIESDKASA
jgi:hypothetical protein